MAFTPISNTVPQYEENGIAASGFYIKFYEAGTTTPTAMATDSTGATLLDKCELNTEGYPKNGSNAVFIPHIDRRYKIALFRNATDADNNNLNNAVWPVDNMEPILTKGSGEVATISALRSVEPASDGQQISLLGHTIAGIGGGKFYYDALDAVSPDNNGTIIVTAGLRRWKRLTERYVDVAWFGAIGDGAQDDYTAIQGALNYAGAASPRLKVLFGPSTYLVSQPMVAEVGVCLEGTTSSGSARPTQLTYSGVVDIDKFLTYVSTGSNQHYTNIKSLVFRPVGVTVSDKLFSYGVYFEDRGDQGTVLDYIQVIGAKVHGVLFSEGCLNTVVSNSRFDFCGGHAIATHVKGTDSLYIRDVTADNGGLTDVVGLHASLGTGGTLLVDFQLYSVNNSKLFLNVSNLKSETKSDVPAESGVYLFKLFEGNTEKKQVYATFNTVHGGPSSPERDVVMSPANDYQQLTIINSDLSVYGIPSYTYGKTNHVLTALSGISDATNISPAAASADAYFMTALSTEGYQLRGEKVSSIFHTTLASLPSGTNVNAGDMIPVETLGADTRNYNLCHTAGTLGTLSGITASYISVNSVQLNSLVGVTKNSQLLIDGVSRRILEVVTSTKTVTTTGSYTIGFAGPVTYQPPLFKEIAFLAKRAGPPGGAHPAGSVIFNSNPSIGAVSYWTYSTLAGAWLDGPIL